MARAQRIRSQEGSWSGRQVCWLGLGLGLLCLVPAALALLGFDFGTGVVPVPADGLAGLSRGEMLEAVHLAARGGYTHTLLEWTAFCAAVFVCGLALAQHRLTQESSLPILGVALLCAGAMDAFHTLAADRLIEAVADNRNLIPFTWAICRLFNGAILLTGLVLAARRSSERFPSGAALVVWISVGFVATAYLTIHLSATSATLPQTMFPDETIRRPYDVYPILPFVLCALVLYFVVLPRRSTAFGQALLLSMIPAVATQLYMAFGSAALHDASFNVAHGLKAVSYAVPLLGLIVEHERTYRRESASALEANLVHRAATVGAEAQSFDAALQACLHLVCQNTGWPVGHAYVRSEDDANLLVPTTLWHFDDWEAYASFQEVTERSTFEHGVGLPGRILASGKAAWICNVQQDDNFARGELCPDSGLKAAFGFPVQIEGRIVAVLEFFSERALPADDRLLAVMQTVGEQLGRVVERNRALDAAQAAEREKSEFVSTVSHEIRTPMTAILGYADEILEGGDLIHIPPERLRALNAIRRNGEHLLQVVNDILDLSRIEEGRLGIEKLRFSPVGMVAEVVSLMRVRASQQGIEMRLEFPTPLPETVEIDPVRLRQVLINLVGNAIKFTERGGVRIVTRWSGPGEDPRVEFEIRDTGIGMTPEEISRLFQRFSQAGASTTRKYGGSGLGLWISRSLVDLMGGSIDVSSEPGRGSAFCVSLPTGLLDGVAILDEPSIALVSPDDPSTAIGSAPLRLDCRVLIADDGPDNRRLVGHLLENLGARVDTVDNGHAALERALAALEDDDPFDVILMDMQMPVLDGFDATRALRRAGYDLPVIALTAQALARDRDRCLAAGCDDFATKPIDRQRLVQKVAHYSGKAKKTLAS